MAQDTTGRKALGVRYDREYDVFYVKLGEGEYEASDDLGGLRHVDYDKNGTVLGVEIVSPSRGVDLTDIPYADVVEAELRRLGLPIEQPASLR